MRNLLFVAALIAITAVPGLSTMIGDQLEWNYYYDGSLLQSGETWTVPGSGGEFSSGAVTYFDVSADGSSITFDYAADSEGYPNNWSSSPLSLSPTIDNGIAINLVSGVPFTAVTIDPATNMAGFGASNISFTATQIQVDWAELPFDSSTIVRLDVATGVPEPCTWALMALGSMALIILWKRRPLPHPVSIAGKRASHIC